MKYNIKKYDFINVEMGLHKFVAIFMKGNKESMLVLPIQNFENPENIEDNKIMAGISISKSSITAYHKLSKEQTENLLYLLNINNAWIKKAIDKELK